MEVIDIRTMFGSWPKRPLELSAADLASHLCGLGIAQAVTTSSMAVLYDDAAGNAETLAQCACQPSLIPAATIHPHDYLGSEGAVGALREQGFSLFRLFNRLQGFSLDLYCLRLLLADLARAGLPCIVDAVALEDAYKLARLSRDTGAALICTNLGYTFEAEIIAIAKEFPLVYYDAGRMTSPDGIALFCRDVGAHRLVYGSDYPFDDVLPSLLLLQHASVSPAELELIASGTIRELLHL